MPMVTTLRPLCLYGSVEWDRMPIQACTSSGARHTRWVTRGMPKLGEYKWLLDIAFFLYETREDAEKGENAGGTGFLVAVPSERWPDHLHHIYGVTNWHNPCRFGASVIRVNSKSGPPDIIERDPSEWYFIPGPHGYDVAVVPLDDVLRPNRHKVEALGPSLFLTPEDISHLEINAAEDVFMLGRFIDYDGIEVNEPSLRFGHISIMAAAIEQPNGCRHTSHVIDMHSRTGYSGSPVFVYRTAGAIFARPNTIMGGGHTLKLLGIHWGQFPEQWEIADGESPKSEAASLITTGKYVKGLSGMTCVCPATSIMEVLQMPSLKKQRQEQEKIWAKRLAGTGLPVAEGAIKDHDEAANPAHREDFNRLLGAAVKPPKPSDQT